MLTRGKLKKACGKIAGYEKGNDYPYGSSNEAKTEGFRAIMNNDKEARELLTEALNEISEYSNLYSRIVEALNIDINNI